MNEEKIKKLIKPSLFYDPPYERPLEDEFAWHLVKYLRPIAGLRYQVKIETPCGNQWVDFVVETPKRRFGFEVSLLDEGDQIEENRYRDAMVIGSGVLNVLYRFRAEDLLYRPHDALYAVTIWDRSIFSDRGHRNLKVLASKQARDQAWDVKDHVARILYADDADVGWGLAPPEELIVRRLSRAGPHAWMKDYDEYLAEHGFPDIRAT